MPKSKNDETASQPVDWSDSWSDEDLADATTAALRYFDEDEQSDHTNWPRLQTATARQLALAIQSDPQIHRTTPAFWNQAKLKSPLTK